MSGNHWWWDVPEFVQAQRDSGFRAWVESIKLGMELGEEPFDEIIPGLSVREPFSDDGIALAEKAFLETFPDRRSVDNNWNLMMRFVKYYGQAYVEELECRWVWQPIVEGHWEVSSPAIERPWPTDMLLPLVPVMNATAGQRRGDDWLFTFNNNRKKYRVWVDQGRPGFAKWKAHYAEIGAV